MRSRILTFLLSVVVAGVVIGTACGGEVSQSDGDEINSTGENTVGTAGGGSISVGGPYKVIHIIGATLESGNMASEDENYKQR